MKHIVFALLVVSSFSMTAQKYKNKVANNVTKDYNGATFSGANTLAENLAESTSFTYASQILANETLAKELAQVEMVTVFVMTDKVFNDMEKEQREAFMANTATSKNMFKSHSVPGRLDATSIKKAIQTNNGSASFLTLQNTKLTAMMKGDAIILKDSEGNQATLIDTNFYHKNGFFHIIDGMAFSAVVE